MDKQAFLTNHFLIAMPALADPNFHQAVAYMCEHNAEGGLGIIINRPTEVSLGELLEHLEIEAANAAIAGQTVYMGGPVQRERGFVLHSPDSEWDSSLRVSEHVSVTTSRDILAAIAQGEGPQRYLVALGYAGWEAGQLEEELAQNAWLSGPADPDIIFTRESGERWQAAAALLGVDITLLSSDAGHA